MFIGSKDIVVWEGDKKHVISYKGQHYTLDGKRMTKAAILARFEMHPAELDRYVAGGFKKCEAYANTNIVSIKRHIYDIQDALVASSFVKESYWRYGAGKAIGFCIMKEENGYNSYEYVGAIVTIQELKPEEDGIEWGEI